MPRASGYIAPMQYRTLGRTGYHVSTVSFGAWAIGGSWGNVDDDESKRALVAAVERGVTFFDTADVYGDGHSERLLAWLRQEVKEPIVVATKVGRGASPHTAENYRRERLTAFVERSLRNLATDCIDLLQLHCPPTDVYYRPECFGVLDELVNAGKVRHYGVSVERVEEALKAIEYTGVKSVQIVYNLFRQRPADLFFARARALRVGVVARLPLSSGLLTGKLSKQSTFAPDDHRSFNRRGEAFDRGETFSGIDYETALELVETLRPLLPQGVTMPEFALRWILMNDAVTCAIPGARRASQLEQNVRAADLPPLTDAALEAVAKLYTNRVRELVHHYW
ncbi:MAG TPA: aldo/keto reductase [Polyangiaceae bacterium]